MVRLARVLLVLLALAGALALRAAPPALGLDLQGGAVLELTAAEPGVAAAEALDQIRRGVDELGIDAVVRPRDDAIVLEVADADEAEVERIVAGVQGVDLRFLLVSPSTWWDAALRADLGAARPGTCGDAPTLEASTRGDLDSALAALAPVPDDRVMIVERRDEGVVAYLAERSPALSGRDVRSAEVASSVDVHQPVVLLRFTDEGGQRFASVTAARLGECLAIVVDGEVVAVPVLRQSIADGKAQISMGARADLAETRRVARALDEGRAILVKLERSHVIHSVFPSWLGLPLLFALALTAALAGALALVSRAASWSLPIAASLACPPLAAALLRGIDGTLTIAFYVGALPAAVAAATIVALALRRRNDPLARRLAATWPGWALLVVVGAAALGLLPMHGFWRGAAVTGVLALGPALVLALLGVLAADERTTDRTTDEPSTPRP